MISVIKRKFGETLKARKFYNQIKEIKIKLLVFNINKKLITLFLLKLRISTEPAIGESPSVSLIFIGALRPL